MAFTMPRTNRGPAAAAPSAVAAVAAVAAPLTGRPVPRGEARALIPVLLLASLLPLASIARPRATVVAQLELNPSPPQRMEPRSVHTPTIEPQSPRTAPIEARPGDDTPKISAPPVAQDTLSARDGDAQAVERELRRLQRSAEAARGANASMASAQAAWQLGLIHLHGAGVRQDAAEAQKWFERAARSGREPWALAGLAWCHIDGCLGPPNPAAAERELAQLRTRHPARADFLAWLAASRQAPVQLARPGAVQDAPAPPLAARALLERAGAAGDVHANLELGLDAFAQQRLDSAAQFFRRAAPRSPAAAANLREVEARIAQSSGKPEAPARRNGEAEAALAQARKYHRGEGVPANFSEAIRFYRLADQRGSAEARRMLALIASRPAPDGSFNVLWMQQLAHVDTGGSIPTVGAAVTAHQLQREPSPLFDLLLPFWQRRVMPVGR